MTPAFIEVANFVREFAGLKRSRPITEHTRLEADLGVTGDDGDELLREAAKRFNVALADEKTGYRATFALGDNEHLFHGEGLDLLRITAFVRWICGGQPAKVRDLTVGELHAAISKKMGELPADSRVRYEGP